MTRSGQSKYIIYFKFKENFEIDNRLFNDYILAQKEAIRLGKAFDCNGEIQLRLSNNTSRHLIFSSHLINVYIMELNSYPNAKL